ncbi:hypothetical protein [Streptomyces noursei]|uniref:hypothetical protein n=1 Tax=Streptomyces noursei TaxID=1971 RepID=UPI001673282A|nr:hypothetical protein [Streptomyces noursei]MCZ1014407.1 hypothetical protein [Streptomyces noursei]GGW94788.1 hypothetical protein GCM10010341_14930 [Streptomyces noursei]
MATAPAPVTAAPALAHRVAEHLPHRRGHAWTAAPYAAWWTTRPAARLTQDGRPGALIITEHYAHTEIAWQAPGREPYEPDLTSDRLASKPVAREILRLVLPRLDDAISAVTYAHPSVPEAAHSRLRSLNAIGDALRAHGAVTDTRVGARPNSHTLMWGSRGTRYAVTLVGTNPACDLSLTDQVTTVEKVLEEFLPERPALTPRFPMRGVSSRLGRRVAAHLAQFTPVDQLDDGGLSFGAATGPFGYVAPPADPIARVRDTTHVTAELHGVGVDHLVHLAPLLAR